MTPILAHAGHYTALFLFGPVLLIALWLFVSDKLEQRRKRRGDAGGRGEGDDSRR
jgi:Sec-independent protein secretion pathway component TatC